MSDGSDYHQIAPKGIFSDQELEEELRHLEQGGDLIFLVFKPEVEEAFSFIPGFIILPFSIVSGILHQGITTEVAAVGLIRTIEVLRRSGDSRLLAASLLSRAASLSSREDWNLVFEMTVEALEMLKRIGRPQELGRAYIRLGSVLKQCDLYYDALTAFEMAAELLLPVGDHAGSAAALYHRGSIALVIGQATEGLRLLDLAQQHLPPSQLTSSWLDDIRRLRITTYLARKEIGAAEKEVDLWLAIDGSNERKSGTDPFPFLVRGRLRIARDVSSGLSDYCTAADLAFQEVMRTRTSRFRLSIRAQFEHLFEETTAAALRAHVPNMVLGLLERSKDIFGAGARKTSSVGEKHTQEALERLRNEIPSLTKRALNAIENAEDTAKSDCQNHAEWIWAQMQLLVQESSPKSLGVSLITSSAARIQSAMPSELVALEYVAVEGQVWVVVVTSTRLEVVKLDLTSDELDLLVRSCTFECRWVLPMHALARLSSQLLMPVSWSITEAETVMIVPTRQQIGVPFHAMPFRRQPLILGKQVIYSPNSSILADQSRHMHSLSNKSSCTFIGVPSTTYSTLPNIPGVYKEVTEIAPRIDATQVFLGPTATSDHLLNPPMGTQILHIACHAIVDRKYPLLSRLLLADRPVFAFEVLMADINADLVVLNACDTGVGTVYFGGETTSMANAFLMGGAKRVLSTWWPVGDDLASHFIRSFYDELLGEQGGSSVRAARSAQIKAAREGGKNHPFYWAPFVISGMPDFGE